ncbi:cell division protein DedD [Proteus mirabilis]|uniref:cell division protein DedD n=1 Tax=Proteus mirabilis TaxID=584 RepID=UPI001C2B80CA|nr:cell division protein DedD [Proteus mirabilis]MBU9977144.1 cell division protein DedD [Proteus mirabilis]MDX4948101.1 cell division protein DedD [Proteus mirabilis]
MASKFQNRLVGAVVLVAVGVIFLPTLFDGDKKYNEDQFASIPLVPKPGDEQDIESIAPIEQTTTPSTPSEGASEAMISEAVTGVEQPQISAPEISESQVAPSTPVVEPPKVVNPPVEPPTTPPPTVPETTAPKGEAWVVQLGVLTNKAKVEEIVAKMHISGYAVYTKSTKIQGNKPATLIFIGPNASKAELQAMLPRLKELTGLQGEVRAYKP